MSEERDELLKQHIIDCEMNGIDLDLKKPLFDFIYINAYRFHIYNEIYDSLQELFQHYEDDDFNYALGKGIAKLIYDNYCHDEYSVEGDLPDISARVLNELIAKRD